MLAFLSVLALAADQPMGAPDCILSALTERQRESIGEAILAKRAKVAADNAAMTKATSDCARTYRLSAGRALHANGSAAMRIAAETLARKLGRPEWAGYALVGVRERSPAQREALADTGRGNAEFELVLTRMINQDRSIGATLQSWDKEPLERFVLMVKLIALAEVERDLAARP